MKLLIGFLSGIISGMGIGGGAVLIPALVFFQSLPQQMAQGINLVCFLPTAIASLAVHLHNKSVEKKTALVIGLSGIFSAAAGAWLATNLSGRLLQRIFGGFLFLLALREIGKGISMMRNRSD